MRIKKWQILVFLLPCFAVFTLIYLIPMVMVFVTSFFEWKSGGVFNFVGFDNYIQAFTQDTRMIAASKNTIIWVLLQSTVHVAIGTILAFMLAKKRHGWKVLRTIYMIPNVISSAAMGVIFLNVFNARYGLLNSLLSVITGRDWSVNWLFDNNTAFPSVTCTWLLYTGMIVIIMLSGVLSIPEDLVEAAKIDGATEFQINFKIRLPLLRGVIGTCVIIAATSMLREFDILYLTTGGGPGDRTLNLPLYLYKTSLTENNYGYANMIGVVLIVSGIVLVYLINKLFRMESSELS